MLDDGELAEVVRHLGRDGEGPFVSDGPALVGSRYDPGEPAVNLWCCGDGYFTAPMTHLSSPSRVYALDLDAGPIDRARLHVAEGGEGDLVVFAADDTMRLPSHVPESASFVLLANTSHDVPDKTGLARRVRSVLTPGGGSRWSTGAPCRAWRPECGESPAAPPPRHGDAFVAGAYPGAGGARGFGLEEVADLPPYHYGAVFVRRG